MFWRKRSGAVVIQTAYMGDVILTTPLLTALAALHGPVDVVATPQSATLLDTHPAVREVIRYDKRGNDRGWPGLRRVASQLRKRGYSAAYLPASLLALRDDGAAGARSPSASASRTAPPRRCTPGGCRARCRRTRRHGSGRSPGCRSARRYRRSRSA